MRVIQQQAKGRFKVGRLESWKVESYGWGHPTSEKIPGDFQEAFGELVRGVTSDSIIYVGAKHLGDYLSGNPQIFISKCFALPNAGGGRSIRVQKSGIYR